MRRAMALVLGVLLCGMPGAAGQELAVAPRVLDDFDTLQGWTAQPADGVGLTIRPDVGRRGRAMRMDFDFHHHGGYAIAHKAIALDLPENYALSFWLRADAPVNNLEVKLIDASGENVWWDNRRDFVFPRQWTKVTIKRRHITFAWGPAGGGTLRHAAAIEIVVTAGHGGRGSVWIDDLAFTPLEPVRPYTRTPRIVASSALRGAAAERVLDGDSSTAWRSAPAEAQTLTLDFRQTREYGGLAIDWAPRDYARRYRVETSSDGVRWETVRTVTGGSGGWDFIDLPESESRWLRLRLFHSARGSGYAIRSLVVEPIEWAATPNDFLRNVARHAARGSFPRYLSDEQAYWTIVGVSGDTASALINEDGMIETGRGSFSLEPFLRVNGRLVTWSDLPHRQSLARGDLPIPSVEWVGDSVALAVTALAAGRPGAATLFARYRVTNRSARPARPTLYVAVRPFQVNPPWQFLNAVGGVAPIRALRAEGGRVRVNGAREVISVTPAAAFGATTFDGGTIVEALREGHLPAATQVRDARGRASGAFAYPLTLPAGAWRDVWVAVPLSGAGLPGPLSVARAEQALAATARAWAAQLDRVAIELPPAAGDIASTIRTTLAYMLISRRGAGIEPGTRAYARSWIRDGSLISAALLRLGAADAVRDFIAWYTPYQYPSGRVPCCVDARGADPVPENDSDGELIYLIAEYWRYTGDRALVEREWPHVVQAMAHIDSLRRSRMTPAYESEERRAFYGLLPQSISHEGYSARPMHSYWDDFFALRGAKDAVQLAAVLGRDADRQRFVATRDALRRDIVASIGRAMAERRIDYLPGSVELGDFDPTSTTIAIAPGGELSHLPSEAVRRTFEEYWERVRGRGDSASRWDSYTPYELRAVGTFVRLGWRARADSLLDFFLASRRPAAWHEWAEVVWRDPRTPRFIGDMPHTWVGSDFVRSVLDMLAYPRERDSALVLGAGVPEAWVMDAPGVAVRRLRTEHGPLTFTMRGDSVQHVVHVHIDPLPTIPPGGVVVRSPVEQPIRGVEIDGAEYPVTSPEEVVVRRLPADLTLRY